MDIGKVVTDAVKYPLSGWNRFFLLGLIFFISAVLSSIPVYIGIHDASRLIFSFIAWLIGLFAGGYLLRIIQASIAELDELPDFDEWHELFINGLKYFLVHFIYFLPAIIIIIISAFAILASFAPYLSDPNLASSLSDPNAVLPRIAVEGVIGIMIALLYLLLIFPIMAIALAHMAFIGEFKAAFRFKEIFSKISSIGWGDMVVWYIMTIVMILIISIVLGLVVGIIVGVVGIINSTAGHIINLILSSLIVNPYLLIYLYRSIASAYVSGE